MEEEKKPEEIQEDNQYKKKRPEDDLPFCTSAPGAEHARAHNEDEPCDDSSSGGVDKA